MNFSDYIVGIKTKTHQPRKAEFPFSKSFSPFLPSRAKECQNRVTKPLLILCFATENSHMLLRHYCFDQQKVFNLNAGEAFCSSVQGWRQVAIKVNVQLFEASCPHRFANAFEPVSTFWEGVGLKLLLSFVQIC